MIGLISQNYMIKKVLSEILSEFSVENYIKGQTYDLVIITEELSEDFKNVDAPIISIGISVPNETAHVDIPVSPQELVRLVKKAYLKNQSKTTFENKLFTFQKSERLLSLKRTDIVFPLTEKENDLLSVLATAFPQALSKEDLLVSVWNYRPDVETHTVETHIYALRQKLGDNADNLIQSTPEGYVLVKE